MTWVPERRAANRARFPAPLLAALALAGIAAPRPAHAVIIFGGDGRNTSAPTGALADSGWQYEGQWGLFLGTPIGPHHFLTANHVGEGAAGNTQFVYQGASYTAVERTYVPGTDLAIWRVDGTFSTYAPVYEGAGEVGGDIAVFGRGTSRGPALTVPGGAQAGWTFGAYDGLQSWGTNVVSDVIDTNQPGQPQLGDLLAWTFDQNQGPNECYLSGGDSGGGVFVNDNGTYKLAGINLGIESYYSFVGADSDKFLAAIYDARGLYLGDNNVYEYQSPSLPNPVPSHAYATRVSSNLDFIKRLVPGVNAPGAAIPEPGMLGTVAAGLLLGIAPLARRRRARAL